MMRPTSEAFLRAEMEYRRGLRGPSGQQGAGSRRRRDLSSRMHRRHGAAASVATLTPAATTAPPAEGATILDLRSGSRGKHAAA